MTDNGTDIFEAHLLKYRKGDLIVKEGDYGISIYRIVKGNVHIYTENEGVEVPLATFGPGEIIGEMLFLKKTTERRTASARALEDSEIEIWHPKMLSKEYQQMPAAIKYIADQALNRLVRMNQILAQLTLRKKQVKSSDVKNNNCDSRCNYRKKVSLLFNGQLINDSSSKIITGHILDISQGGVGLVIENMKIDQYTFKSDQQFFIKTTLPNNKGIEFQTKIVSIKKDEDTQKTLLEMSITRIMDPSKKNLGFYLMA